MDVTIVVCEVLWIALSILFFHFYGVLNFSRSTVSDLGVLIQECAPEVVLAKYLLLILCTRLYLFLGCLLILMKSNTCSLSQTLV